MNNVAHILGYLGWIGGLGFIAFLTVSAVHLKNMERVESMDIKVHSTEEGDEMMSASDVYERMKQHLGYPLIDLPLDELEPDRVERIVRSHPYVQTADVFLDAQNVIHIEVEQKVPVLRVVPRDGTSYYIESEGRPIPLSESFTARVPVATGNLPAMDTSTWSKQDKRNINRVYQINELIRKDAYLNAWIDQMIVHSNGYYSLYSAMTDQFVDLGEGERLEEQLEHVKIFCKNVIPVKGWKKYARLDARYEDQIVGVRRH